MRGLTVTPLQLSRMAKCPSPAPSPTNPTSCSGEVWTGETVYNSGERVESLNAKQINEEEISKRINEHGRKAQMVDELHFGVIFIADGSEAVNASYHQLGWEENRSIPCQANLLYSSSLEEAKLLICENGSFPILPLPNVSSAEFLLLHTSPQLAMSGKFHSFLLGELSKLGVMSPARVESINAGEGNCVSLKIIGQADEVVGMTWVWTDGEKSEKIVTTCTVGQDGSVTMEVLWTEDNLFNSVNCN